jgi:hypothetical protein
MGQNSFFIAGAHGGFVHEIRHGHSANASEQRRSFRLKAEATRRKRRQLDCSLVTPQRHPSAVKRQNERRVPTSIRRGGAADVGWPKNGDVTTPLKFCALVWFSVLYDCA